MATRSSSDVLDALAGVAGNPALAAVRDAREQATAHAQGSYQALFQPTDPAGVNAVERAAIALRVASAHDDPALTAHYRDLLTAAGDPDPGDGRLAAALRHADLLSTRPAEATPADLAALTEAGLSVRDVVTISQVAAFLSFQARVLTGLRLLAGTETPRLRQPVSGPRVRAAAARHPFTQDQLDWKPWLPPLSREEATPEQEAALPGPRANSPYFRLLARDAPILVERTATDEGIFRTEGGLPRGERELAATAASRVNGCAYCASVHSRFASTYSGRREDVQRLLDEGVEAAQDERWRALVDFAAALTPTPPVVEPADLERLRAVGLDDLAVLDLVQATAFFAWANRLMLTLGEPV